MAKHLLTFTAAAITALTLTALAATKRPLCSRCLRPLRSCLCSWIRPTHNQVSVLVLQHPAEANHAKGSTRLLALSLSDCSCWVGERFDPLDLPGGPIGDTALLYPAAPGAGQKVPVDDNTLEVSQPVTGGLAVRRWVFRRLLVLDGTWRQSRSLLRLNPWLLELPRVTLASPPPSRYHIRKPHLPDQRSTLEATCLALGDLESRPAHYAALLQAFEGWIGALQSHRPLTSE